MKPATKYLVLSAISNDYEDFDTVFGEVTKWAQERGVSLSRSQTIGILEEVIRDGFAKAYVLSAQSRDAQPAVFSSADIARLWFYVTPSGKRLVADLDRNLKNGSG